MLALLQAMIPESHKSGHGMAKTGKRGSRWDDRRWRVASGGAPCGNHRVRGPVSTTLGDRPRTSQRKAQVSGFHTSRLEETEKPSDLSKNL